MIYDSAKSLVGHRDYEIYLLTLHKEHDLTKIPFGSAAPVQWNWFSGDVGNLSVNM
jgi:hypothetical protein